MHHVQQEVHKKYGMLTQIHALGNEIELEFLTVELTGPIVRIAPNEVSSPSPSAAKEIYSVGKGFNKVEGYAIFPTGGNTDIFTEPNEARHAIKRRIASGAYSMKTVTKMEEDVNNIKLHLFDRLDELYVDKAECDLGAWVENFAFDVSSPNYTSCLHALTDNNLSNICNLVGYWADSILERFRLHCERDGQDQVNSIHRGDILIVYPIDFHPRIQRHLPSGFILYSVPRKELFAVGIRNTGTT